MSKILMVVLNDFVNDSRIIKEANSLGMNGHTVKVLALHNDNLLEEEKFDYFNVKRIKLKTRNTFGKSFISYGIKFLEFLNKCKGEAKKFNPDFIHCHDVYAMPITNAIIKSLNKRPKLIYDSHELWSQAANNKSMNKLLLSYQNRIEKRTIKKCDAVITVSNSISEYLAQKFMLSELPVVIRNIPKLSNINCKNNMFLDEYGFDKNKKVILYQGLVSTGRGIEKLIESMKFLNDCVLVIMGNGDKVEFYKNMIHELKLEGKVYLHKAVPTDVLMNYTSSADLGVSLIGNFCLSYYYCLPNKMFEYIQAGVPVLCSSFPDMEHIVEEYNVGICAKPDDVNSIVKSINKLLFDEKLYSNMKANCIKAREELNWENEQKKLIGLYNKLI